MTNNNNNNNNNSLTRYRNTVLRYGNPGMRNREGLRQGSLHGLSGIGGEGVDEYGNPISIDEAPVGETFTTDEGTVTKISDTTVEIVTNMGKAVWNFSTGLLTSFVGALAPTAPAYFASAVEKITGRKVYVYSYTNPDGSTGYGLSFNPPPTGSGNGGGGWSYGVNTSTLMLVGGGLAALMLILFLTKKR